MVDYNITYMFQRKESTEPGSSPPSTGSTLSRRNFLRATLAGVVSGAVLGFGLKERQPGESEVVTSFLKEAQVALTNLEILAHHPGVNQIRAAVRQRYPNPDINPDDVVFFLRDKTILEKGVHKVKMNSRSIKTSAELDGIIAVSDHPVTLTELKSPVTERRLTPKTISHNYALIGTQSGRGKGVVKSDVEFLDEVNEKERAFAIEAARNKIQSVVSRLTIPDVAIKVYYETGTGIGGSFRYEPWKSYTPELVFLWPLGSPAQLSEAEILEITHEAAHSLDITINPTLMQRLTPDQIVELSLLRYQAEAKAYPIDLEGLYNKKIRGDVVDVKGYIGKRVSAKGWLLANSKNSPITDDEIATLSQVYPTSLWSNAFISMPTARELDARFFKETVDLDSRLMTWEEFRGQGINSLKAVMDADPLLKYAYQISQDRVQNLQLVGQKSISSWVDIFLTALQDDFIKKGGGKAMLEKGKYKQYLNEFTIAYTEAEIENLAEQTSFIQFLQHYRQQDPSQLNSGYWKYYTKIAGLLK